MLNSLAPIPQALFTQTTPEVPAYGDAIGNLLEHVGYSVHREFYMNDRGLQMAAFGRSLEARKNNESPPEDGYGEANTSVSGLKKCQNLSLEEIIAWGCEFARNDQPRDSKPARYNIF